MNKYLLKYNHPLECSGDFSEIRVEAMIYHDQENGEDFAILKLENPTNDEIRNVEILLQERNVAFEVIRETKYAFQSLRLGAGQSIVPFQKFRLLPDTVTMQYLVLSVKRNQEVQELDTIEKEMSNPEEAVSTGQKARIVASKRTQSSFPFLISLAFLLIFVLTVYMVF
ncbi:MAG: hypothetical protein PHP32_01655 [Candidatus Izemoplasmatales bacterium]|nr:hypothetical protein [Candidatus Izemoplasmatales bacterium]